MIAPPTLLKLMRFSSQILDKSVPEWKHNNIDYNKIKQIIKLQKHDNQLLIRTFNDQFRIVNIFVSLKIKEISTRIVSIESSIIKFSRDQNTSSETTKNNVELDRVLLKKKLKLIKNHTRKCSKELEKLSRFNIFQKIATRKLFHKIIKYYDEELGNKCIKEIKSLPMYSQGYENISFNLIDLNPYFLELSLILDVINDFTSRLKNVNNDVNISGNKLESKKIDYFIKEASFRAKPQLLDGELNKSNKNENTSKHISTILEYDRMFLGESENIQKFLITKEDTEEFKFMLLTGSFQLFDENILSTSRDIVETTSNYLHDSALTPMTNLDDISNNNTADHHLNTKPSLKSLRSFKDVLKTCPKTSLLVTSQDDSNDTGVDLSENMISIKNLVTINGNCLRYQVLDNLEKSQYENHKTILNNESINQFPNVIVSNKDYLNPLIMCHIGGIRDHCIADDIDKETLDTVLSSSDNSAEINIKDYKFHISKLILEWLQSHHLQPTVPDISFKRVRFVSYHQNKTYLLSLSEEIIIGEKIKLPYCIFELRCIQKKPNSKFVDKLYSNIINKNISCYPIPHDLTPWKIAFTLYKTNKYSKQDVFALMLADSYALNEGNSLTEEEFFSLGKSAIVELCSNEIQVEYNELLSDNNDISTNTNVDKLSSINNETTHKKPVRYWNEFDDGEENPDYYQSFYVDDDDNRSSLSDHHEDRGFIKFDKRFINDLYQTCQNIKNALTFHKRKEYPLDVLRNRYGSIVSSNEDLETLLRFTQQDIDESESTYEFKHDEMITLLYISALAISTIITIMAVSIVIALFREESQNIVVSHKTVLIVIIIFALILALFLITMSLLLLFSRFTLAPTWHYISCFVLFTIVTVSVCYGIIEIYF